MYDIWGTTWTPQEKLAFRSYYTPQICGASLGFCIVAQILVYIFSPKLRTFPRSVLCWLNYYNIYYCLYAILKWTTTSPLYNLWTLHMDPNSPSCKIVVSYFHLYIVTKILLSFYKVFIETSFMVGQTVGSTLICLTLLLLIVCRVSHEDMERKKKYYWSYLIFTLAYPFGSGAIAMSLRLDLNQDKRCVVADRVQTAILRSPYILFIIFQIVSLCIVVYKIKKVSRTVRTSIANGTPIEYVYFRFMAMFIAQTYNMFPMQANVIFTITGNAIWDRFLLVSHASGPLLDSLVIIIGNAEFLKWVSENFETVSKKVQNYFTKPPKSPPTNISVIITQDTCKPDNIETEIYEKEEKGDIDLDEMKEPIKEAEEVTLSCSSGILTSGDIEEGKETPKSSLVVGIDN